MSERAIEIVPANNGNFSHDNAWQAIIPGVSQVVDIGASSVASTAFSSKTSLVRVTANQDCFISFGATPVANTTTSIFLPLGAVDYFGVIPGTKLAVIQSSMSGTIFITEGL